LSRPAVAPAARPGIALEIRGLSTTFGMPEGLLRAVDGIDLEVRSGEVLGLVGESGSGKSVTLRSLVRLVRPPGRVAGQALWQGRDLISLPEAELRDVRGREIAMIFQEPMTALNPVLTVRQQIDENLAAHTALGRGERRRRAIGLLDLVGIPSATARLDDYPHQFSGGMRQRVMIAIALASEPRVLLADEPTTALDVTIQDQILKLLLQLREELGMSVILVTPTSAWPAISPSCLSSGLADPEIERNLALLGIDDVHLHLGQDPLHGLEIEPRAGDLGRLLVLLEEGKESVAIADRFRDALLPVGLRPAHHGMGFAARLRQQVVGVDPRFVAALLAVGHGVGDLLESLGD
jgi:ABC-type dipeptide/oligopeptide/nickel transport system ATPase subunit